MLISSEYLELNRRLHRDPNYGTSGRKYAQRVLWLTESRDILDYGCGKRTLETWLGFEIKNYDPVTYPERPFPSEVVVCTDVLEHIEEGCLEAVLDDLRRVVSGFGYFTIATGPAKKVLPDGRNAHLIQMPARWWLERLSKRFRIDGCVMWPNGFEVFVS